MMKRIRLYRNLRSAFILGPLLVLALLFLAATSFILWANHTGMPTAWREKFESELSRSGTFLRIGGLHYSPLRGITAKHLILYRDAARTIPIAKIETVQLDLDHLELSRGNVHILRASLNKAQVTLAVNPDSPSAGEITINQLEGEITFSNQLQRHLSNIRGKISNIPFEINGEITWYKPDATPSSNSAEENTILFTKIKHTLQQLEKIHFPKETPPLLQIDLYGDLNNYPSLKAQIKFFAPALQYHSLQLFNSLIQATWTPRSLEISTLKTHDHSGHLNLRAHYLPALQKGTFQIASTLSLIPILNELPNLSQQAVIQGSSTINASGEFSQNQNQSWKIQTIGEAKLHSIRLKNILFDQIETNFSWQNGDIYLTDILVKQNNRQATARFLFKDHIGKFQLNSTLPLSTFRPFIKKIPLEHVLNDFQDQPSSEFQTSLQGHFNTQDHFDWSTKGTVQLSNASYRHAPFHFAKSTLDLSHQALRFIEPSADIDYSHSPLTALSNKIPISHAQAQEICFDNIQKFIQIDDFQGNLWPASILVTFAPKTAKIVEKYRFHTPPQVHANGRIWLYQHEKNRLEGTFSSPDPVETELLNTTLKTSNATGSLQILGHQTNVSLVANHFENLNLLNHPTNGEAVQASVRVENEDIQVQFHTQTLNDLIINQQKTQLLNTTGKLHISPDHQVHLDFHSQTAKNLSLYHSPCQLNNLHGKLAVQDNLSHLTFQSESLENFSFLGKNLTLRNVQGTAQISPQSIAIPSLTFQTLGGNVSAKFSLPNSPSEASQGEIIWNQIQLPEIASTYQFTSQSGALSGRIELSQIHDRLDTLNATGLVSLENGELFSVPIFGPLSPLIAASLGNRNAGWSFAKQAFCNFQIKNAQLHTNDFYTSTSSLVFTGDAQIDLVKKSLSMTLRMNAKGFLGLITLPLRPFYGLFQFRGEGPIGKPEWRNVIFTSPPKSESDRLLTPPKAIQIPQ